MRTLIFLGCIALVLSGCGAPPPPVEQPAPILPFPAPKGPSDPEQPVTRFEEHMTKYVKKRVFIEAMQYTGTNGAELAIWSQGAVHEDVLTPQAKADKRPKFITVKTDQGPYRRGAVGCYVVKDTDGFYPWDKGIFEDTYELPD